MSRPPPTDKAKTIILPAILDRRTVAALLPDLRTVAAHAPVILDASGVERIGQVGLQLLLSAHRTGDGAVRLCGASPAVKAAAALAGVDALPPFVDRDGAA